jgi:glycosyltransferase involved in cell wall biosynthesis
VASLTDGLVRRGHHVTLFASGDSRTLAELHSPVARALRLNPRAGDPLAAHALELAQVFERANDFDVIHCHVDFLAFPFGRLVRTPTIHTLHGRLDFPHYQSIFRHMPDVHVVSISDAQRAPLRQVNVNWAATVHHGISLRPFGYGDEAGDYLAFLGRVAPEKGPALAIAVAKRVGIPLKMAAKVDPADRAYFESEIRPLLNDPLIEFLGELDEPAKSALLRGAAALLFPIDWPEPFGLVMVEAMACGTPVIARSCGSVPELLVPGRTGFVVDTFDELVDAVKRVSTIERAACRRHVEQRFTVERMVENYESIYRSLTAVGEAA